MMIIENYSLSHGVALTIGWYVGSSRERSKDWKLLLGWFLYGFAFYDASVRLGDQLDVKTRAIVNLKQEISARDEMIKSCQEKLLKHSNSQVCTS